MTVSSGTLRALVAAATPGPWESRERSYRVLTNVGEAYPAGRGRFGFWEDAQLAALAPDLALLLADTMDALDMVRGMLRFSEDQEAGDKMLNPLLARFRDLVERAG